MTQKAQIIMPPTRQYIKMTECGNTIFQVMSTVPLPAIIIGKHLFYGCFVIIHVVQRANPPNTTQCRPAYELPHRHVRIGLHLTAAVLAMNRCDVSAIHVGPIEWSNSFRSERMTFDDKLEAVLFRRPIEDTRQAEVRRGIHILRTGKKEGSHDIVVLAAVHNIGMKVDPQLVRDLVNILRGYFRVPSVIEMYGKRLETKFNEPNKEVR